ncbi:MAG: MFS transporter, partial [Bryobacteraceae bacterium]
MPVSSPGVLFRHANFRYYLMVRVLTATASEMQAVAVAWQIYGLTHRPLDLGLVGLAQTADRFPRRRILQACCAGFALCSLLLLGLTLHGLSAILPIYAVLLFNGTVRAFNGPAGQAFLPLLVQEEHFPQAVAWNSSIFQAATIAGPVVGGLLYGWTGSPVPVYGCAAIEYVGALLVLAGIRIVAAAGPRPAASYKMALEGLRYIRRNKLILGAISLDLFAVLLGGAVALLPVYAREILKVGAWGLGILRSAPGLGAVLMALVVARWPLERHAGAIMLWCVCGFGIFTVVFGLSRNLAL